MITPPDKNPKSYLPTLFSPEKMIGKFKCRPGDSFCSGIASDVTSSILGIDLNDTARGNAWDKLKQIEKQGGKKVYEFGTNTDYSNTDFSVGDFIHFDRKGVNRKEGDIDHVGVIIGKNEQGIPLIYHGSKTNKDGISGNHVIETIDKVGTKYGYDYIPKFTTRLKDELRDYSNLPMFFKEQIKREQQTNTQPANTTSNSTANSNTMATEKETKKQPTVSNSSTQLKEYLLAQKEGAKGNKARAITSLLAELDEGTEFDYNKSTDQFTTKFSEGREAGTTKAGRFIGQTFGINKRKLAENALLGNFFKDYYKEPVIETSTEPEEEKKEDTKTDFKGSNMLPFFSINPNIGSEGIDYQSDVFGIDLRGPSSKTIIKSDESTPPKTPEESSEGDIESKTFIDSLKEKYPLLKLEETNLANFYGDSNIATKGKPVVYDKGYGASIGDFKFFIPSSVATASSDNPNIDEGSLIIPNTSISNARYGSAKVKDILGRLNTFTTSKKSGVPFIGVKKKGGIIKAQQGVGMKGTYEGIPVTDIDLLAENGKVEKKEPTEVEWDTEDYVRLGAVAGDVLGSIASVVPLAGSTTSSALGLGSTLGYAFADWQDEDVSASDALINLGINAALDVGTFFTGPLAKSAKVGKALTAALPLFKKAISAGILAGGVYGTMSNSDQYGKIFNKIESGNYKDITTKELELLAQGLAVITGAGNMARQGLAKTKKVEIDSGKVDEQGNPIKEIRTVLDIDKAALKDSAGKPVSTKYSYNKPNRDKKVGALPFVTRNIYDAFGNLKAKAKTFADPIRNRATRSLAFDTGKRQAASDYYGNIRTNMYRGVFGGSEFKPLGKIKSGTDFTYTGNFKSTPTINSNIPPAKPQPEFGPFPFIGPRQAQPIPPENFVTPLRQRISSEKKLQLYNNLNKSSDVRAGKRANEYVKQTRGFSTPNVNKQEFQSAGVFKPTANTKAEYDMINNIASNKQPFKINRRMFSNLGSRAQILSRPHRYSVDTDNAFHKMVDYQSGTGQSVFNKIYPDGRVEVYRLNIDKVDPSFIEVFKKGGIVKAQSGIKTYEKAKGFDKKFEFDKSPMVSKDLLDLDKKEFAETKNLPGFKDKVKSSVSMLGDSIKGFSRSIAGTDRSNKGTTRGGNLKENAGKLLKNPLFQNAAFIGAQALANKHLLQSDVKLDEYTKPQLSSRPIMIPESMKSYGQKQIGQTYSAGANPLLNATVRTDFNKAMQQGLDQNKMMQTDMYLKELARTDQEKRQNQLAGAETDMINTQMRNQAKVADEQLKLENRRQLLSQGFNLAGQAIARYNQKGQAEEIGVRRADMSNYDDALALLDKNDPNYETKKAELDRQWDSYVGSQNKSKAKFKPTMSAKKGGTLTFGERKALEKYKAELKKAARKDKAKLKELKELDKFLKDSLKSTEDMVGDLVKATKRPNISKIYKKNIG